MEQGDSSEKSEGEFNAYLQQLFYGEGLGELGIDLDGLENVD